VQSIARARRREVFVTMLHFLSVSPVLQVRETVPVTQMKRKSDMQEKKQEYNEGTKEMIVIAGACEKTSNVRFFGSS